MSLGSISSALVPLQSAGKLAAVLFQFPPWFIPNRHGYAHVLTCAEKLEAIQVAIEFRNKIGLRWTGAGRS
jgi:uncharacterized protein YecE (DUF72 family)